MKRLSWIDKRRIRKLKLDGWKALELAAMYKVSPQAIGRVGK